MAEIKLPARVITVWEALAYYPHTRRIQVREHFSQTDFRERENMSLREFFKVMNITKEDCEAAFGENMDNEEQYPYPEPENYFDTELAVSLSKQGFNAKKIAEILNSNEETVTSYLGAAAMSRDARASKE